MFDKEVTIYDIADRLLLSSATVSRALQNSPSVTKQTRKRVWDTAKEMGYRYNAQAGSLRKKRTKTIGVIVHELNSSFITSVLSGIEKVTTDAGYDLIIAHSGESFEKEKANAESLFHKRVDGLIASLSFDSKSLDHFTPFTRKGIPVIFFDRVEEESPMPKVIIDNQKCGYLATKHLIDQGCEKIAMITASLERNVYKKRFSGFQEALQEAGLEFRDEWLMIYDLSEQSGLAAAERILTMKDKPDGIFCTNDFVAAVCMTVLQENGIQIPADIAFVGFNNDSVSKIVSPKLTTIRYPGFDMGEVTAMNLINYLSGFGSLQKTETIIVNSELIIRNSSLKKETARKG